MNIPSYWRPSKQPIMLEDHDELVLPLSKDFNKLRLYLHNLMNEGPDSKVAEAQLQSAVENLIDNSVPNIVQEQWQTAGTLESRSGHDLSALFSGKVTRPFMEYEIPKLQKQWRKEVRQLTGGSKSSKSGSERGLDQVGVRKPDVAVVFMPPHKTHRRNLILHVVELKIYTKPPQDDTAQEEKAKSTTILGKRTRNATTLAEKAKKTTAPEEKAENTTTIGEKGKQWNKGMSQAILYLSQCNDYCGTYLGTFILRTEFARLCVDNGNICVEVDPAALTTAQGPKPILTIQDFLNRDPHMSTFMPHDFFFDQSKGSDLDQPALTKLWEHFSLVRVIVGTMLTDTSYEYVLGEEDNRIVGCSDLGDLSILEVFDLVTMAHADKYPKYWVVAKRALIAAGKPDELVTFRKDSKADAMEVDDDFQDDGCGPGPGPGPSGPGGGSGGGYGGQGGGGNGRGGGGGNDGRGGGGGQGGGNFPRGRGGGYNSGQGGGGVAQGGGGGAQGGGGGAQGGGSGNHYLTHYNVVPAHQAHQRTTTTRLTPYPAPLGRVSTPPPTPTTAHRSHPTLASPFRPTGPARPTPLSSDDDERANAAEFQTRWRSQQRANAAANAAPASAPSLTPDRRSTTSRMSTPHAATTAHPTPEEAWAATLPSPGIVSSPERGADSRYAMGEHPVIRMETQPSRERAESKYALPSAEQFWHDARMSIGGSGSGSHGLFRADEMLRMSPLDVGGFVSAPEDGSEEEEDNDEETLARLAAEFTLKGWRVRLVTPEQMDGLIAERMRVVRSAAAGTGSGRGAGGLWR